MKTINQKKYQKYIKEVVENNEKMSLFCHQNESNTIIIEGKRVKFQGIIFAYSRGDFHVCFGHVGGEPIFYSSDDSCKDHLYIIIDQSKDKKRFHINYKDQYVTHSEKDFYEERETIFTYVENQNFAQLQVYDSFLKHNRFGEYFADTLSTIGSARCLALGQLVNIIPGITQAIPELYENKIGDES
ncbi:hypothetical protein ACQKL5_19790 [Peribacillus sp. NPDC097675]|uniref:hypothetical protein n=1 Tax=Peribacillus sp. NPDC097675 TaxID=3390618 RepID=UPI003CFCD4A5